MKKLCILPLLILIFLFSEVYGQITSRGTMAPSYPDSVITWKFDSAGDSALNAKMTYRYDNHMHVIESEKFIRELSLNLWVPNRKDVREYDNNDRRTLWAIYEWDNNAMAYKGWIKETTLFDNHGNQAEYHYYTWDYTHNDWGNRFWDLFYYDNEDKLTRRDHLEWDLDAEQWDTASYDIYDYGDDDLLQHMTTWEPYEDFGGKIYPSERRDYQYDASGNEIEWVGQMYNPGTELWYFTTKLQYTYDVQNRKTHSIYSEYDEHGEKWFEKEKEDWGWDDNDSLTLYAYYRIGEDTLTWYPDLKAEMTYNSQGKLLHYRSYEGNEQAQWVPAYERRYPYMNDTLLLADSLFQWIEADQVWEFVDCSIYQYDSRFRLHTDSYYKLVVHTGEYLLNFRDYYFYSESSGIEEPFAEQLMVYPNPTRGKFQISNSKFQINSKIPIQNIEVVDLNGKVIKEIVFDFEFGACLEFGAWNLEFDISRCPPGIYFIRIHLENQTIVKKIVKL